MNELRQLLLTLPEEVALALNGYFEARGDWQRIGETAYLAVMAVVENRALNPKCWPNTIQEVIAQKAQFSWTNSNDPQYENALQMALNPEQEWDGAWKAALETAKKVVKMEVKNPVANATYYYNPQVCHPNWAANFEEVAVIGHHRFMTDPQNDPETIWPGLREA
jgi:spore germination cell wall hydrolase CwlJ-like protein